MANQTVRIEQLGDAIRRELTVYKDELVGRIDKVGEEEIKKLVKLTVASAPEQTGFFKRNITFKKLTRDWKETSKFVWYVRAPAHRLTHLLVHGHANVDGSRTPGNPFLYDALDEVLPEYQRRVEEAIENG